MITVILLVVALWHFYLGYSRGIIKQTYQFLAAVAALAVAGTYYRPLSDILTFWVPYTQAVEEVPLSYFSEVNIFEMDTVFYAGIAFVALFFASFALLNLLSVFLHLFPLEGYDDPTLNVVSGFLAVLIMLMGLSLLLTLAATLPVAALQDLLAGNFLMKGLIAHFPVLSQLIRHLWVVVPLG